MPGSTNVVFVGIDIFYPIAQCLACGENMHTARHPVKASEPDGLSLPDIPFSFWHPLTRVNGDGRYVDNDCVNCGKTFTFDPVPTLACTEVKA